MREGGRGRRYSKEKYKNEESPTGSFRLKQNECTAKILKVRMRTEIWRQLECKIKQLRFDFK